MRAVLLALALLAATGATQAQQYYKWKDANGVTHYSKTPPPEGTEADRLAVKAEAPSATPAPAGKAPAGGAAAAAGGAAEMRSAKCEEARAAQATLESNPFVSMDKDGDGKVELLSVEEHNAQLARARDFVRTACPPGTPGG